MIFDSVVKNRRSIRKFTTKMPTEDAIYSIVDIARISPSAKNRQPWYFQVLTGDAKLRFVADYLSCVQNSDNSSVKHSGKIMQTAPVIIAVYLTENGFTDMLSIGGAIYGMCLKATDLGLGSLWIGDTDIMRDLTDYERLISAVAIGYAEECPNARSRKTISEISNLSSTPNKNQSIVDDIINPDISDSNYIFISYSHKDSGIVIEDINHSSKDSQHGYSPCPGEYQSDVQVAEYKPGNGSATGASTKEK